MSVLIAITATMTAPVIFSARSTSMSVILLLVKVIGMIVGVVLALVVGVILLISAGIFVVLALAMALRTPNHSGAEAPSSGASASEFLASKLSYDSLSFDFRPK